MLYSKSTGCVYFEGLHGENIPADAVPIPNERYDEVIANPTAGKVRDHDADGLPILVDPPAEVLTIDVLKARVSNLRWKVETGGIVLPNGIKVATALDDQNRITTVVANARLAGLETVNFKAATGWVSLSLAEIESIAAAVAMHVQACFTAERAHHEAIDSIAVTEDPAACQAALDSYDESQGWPS